MPRIRAKTLEDVLCVHAIFLRLLIRHGISSS
jgi:hypothetical protein